MVVLQRSVVTATALFGLAQALRTSLHGFSKPIGAAIEEARFRSVERNDQVATEALFPTYALAVPIDHFHNESRYEPHGNDTFNLRYWFDATYYRPGGPVFLVQAGETSGKDRLPFLQKGLVHQLAKGTNGIGVILEHRYYGKSFPTPDLSAQNLRFLTTEQAMADEAYFAQHIEFPGLEKFGDLTSNSVPYIGYGGSYAGAFNAFLRVQYPDVFWGTISSSGVTLAIDDYWQYYTPIADFAPRKCIAALQTFTRIMDNIFIHQGSIELQDEVKSIFRLSNVTHVPDVASTLTRAVDYWQEQNWDPAINALDFNHFCSNITSTELLYSETHLLRSRAEALIRKGGEAVNKRFVNQFLNYIGYVNATQVAPCAANQYTQEECFGNYDAKTYQSHSLDDTWRAWPYQYCTEWGYFTTGSGAPEDASPLISRTIDVEHESLICKYAFNITTPPELDRINKYGGYNISYPRLAFIDGDRDPWRPATPHAFEFGARNRTSTASEPFFLIENGIHHFDQNGLLPNETTSELPPAPVKEIQALELAFLKEWINEWKLAKMKIKQDL